MNGDDRAFLDQIFDHPEDQSVRLVYADWLEERGDPRGELLRLRGELASLSEKDRCRAKLRQRERELTAACDEDWLVLLERADWKLRYRELEPTGAHAPRWVPAMQKKIGEALRAFEAEFGHPLPRSYKAYAHVFGYGEMAGFFRITDPCARDSYDTPAGFNREIQESHGETFTGQREWLKKAIFFAATIGGEFVAWDTAVVNDPVGHEYRVCCLTRSGMIHRTADSFPQFIDEICLTVFDEEGEQTPQTFHPYRLGSPADGE